MIIPNKIFIIPYRNRKEQLHHFNIYMKYILEDIPKNEYEIYFVHQCDSNPFNRGAMKNIGFLVMKNKYPNDYKNISFIFNDIDTIPYTKNLLNYDTSHGVIKHFYGFTFALGGIFSIKGKDFEKCKGFPNHWGWGLEDNCIYKRAIDNKITIDRNNFYKFGSHNIIHILDDLSKITTKQDVWRVSQNPDNIYNIYNLKYDLKDNFINVTSFNTKIDPNHEIYETKNMTVNNSNIIKKDPFYNPIKTNSKKIGLMFKI
jgi:hypothetical protein